MYACVGAEELVRITSALYTIFIYFGISIQFLIMYMWRADIISFIVHLENYVNESINDSDITCNPNLI